jgi:phosphopantothenoylcysteine decarboxylase/phosphopantothenate--cysteine ligase
MRLAGKRILLGVTGSISAYKSADLCRLLIKEGAEVRVIMTPGATDFITPLTLSTLSGNPIPLHMISGEQTWNNHVELGLWGQLLLIAPASANTISAMTAGTCTNLLQAVFLSARCPVMIAPAMDHDMFLHAATTTNLEILRKRNVLQIGPETGALASGLTGEGRLTEPANILEKVAEFFNITTLPLQGNKVLVTAGPTREAIDPVRYISNHSTGKMGVAIAKAFAEAGAEVHLVAGPLQVSVPPFIKHYPVESADEMNEVCNRIFPDSNIAVLTAAVADFKPANTATQKIKKDNTTLHIDLVANPDILEGLGRAKKAGQFLAGFALETENGIANASKKLKNKNLNLIVLNEPDETGSGFGHDTNKVIFIAPDTAPEELPLMEKSAVARALVLKIIDSIHVQA